MAKLNLSKPIIGLDKEIVVARDTDEKLMMNHIVGNILANTKSKEPLVALSLGMKIYESKGEIDLSPKEISLIEEGLEKSQLPAISEAQIIEQINSVKQ